MAEVTLPTGPQKPLDIKLVRTLVLEAILAAARQLKNAGVKTARRVIYRKSVNPQITWSGDLLETPHYHASIWDVRTLAAQTPEAKALTSYLWDAGALPKKLSRNDDQNPTREAWEDFTWAELVQVPLVYLCEQSALRSLSISGSCVPWALDNAEAAAAADDVSSMICNNVRHVSAICPLMRVELDDESVHDLGGGITIRKLSIDEQCLLLTRFHGDYSSDDSSFWWNHGILQIEFDTAGTPGAVTCSSDAGGEAAQKLLAKIDLVKWALTAGAASDVGLSEASVVGWSPSGWKMWTLRRQSSVFGLGGFLPVNALSILQSKHLLLRVRSLLDAAPELESILWFLGRSHLAATPRDALLEATIGLESLLVPGPGESTYKLGLHGAAILSSAIAEGVDRDLVHIYRLRSSAAHGTAKDQKDFERLAPRARYLLTKAIEGMLTVFESGELGLLETQGDLGKAVAELVLRRCLQARTKGGS